MSVAPHICGMVCSIITKTVWQSVVDKQLKAQINLNYRESQTPILNGIINSGERY